MTRRGAIVWFTGLSGAGKSTLATQIARRVGRARAVEVLDGDEMRARLGGELGFDRADRDANVFRIAFVARLLAKHGVLVLVAAIAPYATTRDAVRERCAAEGITFLEVFVDAPLEIVIQRDVKGLYRRALTGELPRLTGMSDPYEPPAKPELAVATDREPISSCVERVIARLADAALV